MMRDGHVALVRKAEPAERAARALDVRIRGHLWEEPAQPHVLDCAALEPGGARRTDELRSSGEQSHRVVIRRAFAEEVLFGRAARTDQLAEARGVEPVRRDARLAQVSE